MELEVQKAQTTTPTASLLARIARHPQWLGAGVIVIAFLLLILAINPVHEFPVEDDWDYSKTVWNVLQTGAFHRLEVTQATVFFPALWGALFSKLFGYSLTTLRASTLVLAVSTLLFFYALLGELEFDVPRRVLATLSLMLAPAFVYLAFSFMTDVPLFFCILAALYFYMRAWRSNNLLFAVLASIFAALGFLARQVGALVPISFALFVLLYGRNTKIPLWKWIASGVIIPLLVVSAYLAWSQFFGGANWADRARTLTGTIGFWFQLDTPGVFVRRYAVATATLGIYILPLWLAVYPALFQVRDAWQNTPRLAKLLVALVTLLSIIALVRAATRYEWFPYLTDILTRAGMRPYLAFFAEGWGYHRPLIFSDAASAILTLLAGAIGIVLSALIIGRWGKPFSPPLALIYLTTLILALASLTFFTYFERYLLPLLPGVIILLLDVTRRVRVSILAGAVGLIVVALFSIALMQDYFAWNQVRWDAGRDLLTHGAPVERIDGGYEWNGWHLYDASVAFIRAQNVPMTIDPWKYILDPQYMFTFQPVPDYHIMQEYPFATPLRAGGTDKLYLLERNSN
ncbi:MAG TPA: glycosyltransferase family 39 protein [Anaerolineae bacterium]|nr:glycosyltransferase family 39 protein [Anaerolineae bacterium]